MYHSCCALNRSVSQGQEGIAFSSALAGKIRAEIVLQSKSEFHLVSVTPSKGVRFDQILTRETAHNAAV